MISFKTNKLLIFLRLLPPITFISVAGAYFFRTLTYYSLIDLREYIHRSSWSTQKKVYVFLFIAISSVVDIAFIVMVVIMDLSAYKAFFIMLSILFMILSISWLVAMNYFVKRLKTNIPVLYQRNIRIILIFCISLSTCMIIKSIISIMVAIYLFRLRDNKRFYKILESIIVVNIYIEFIPTVALFIMLWRNLKFEAEKPSF